MQSPFPDALTKRQSFTVTDGQRRRVFRIHFVCRRNFGLEIEKITKYTVGPRQSRPVISLNEEREQKGMEEERETSGWGEEQSNRSDGESLGARFSECNTFISHFTGVLFAFEATRATCTRAHTRARADGQFTRVHAP